jgi:hypothetical protein
MSEDIEKRVADSIYEALPPGASSYFGTEDIRNLARSAIAAMREPTEAGCDADMSPGMVKGAWRDMIDKALEN